MPRVMAQSAVLVGAVVILLGVALGLTSYLVDAQIPEALVEWVKKHFHSPWAFLLALNGMLLVLGSVFEIYAAIIVLAPLVAPLGVAFNIDPVHLGVVFLANLELGFLFPPLGLNLFLSASRFNKPLPYLYRQALPFLVVMAIGVLIVTYVPALTTGVATWLSR
jgi:TRAP-type C4-dicarboxylate transport system permease large subunit